MAARTRLRSRSKRQSQHIVFTINQLRQYLNRLLLALSMDGSDPFPLIMLLSRSSAFDIFGFLDRFT
jgi:hypothetical protein